MTTNQAGLGAGYNPYDTSNKFMEKWYQAATALDPRNSADAEKFDQMTGSPMHARVVQSLVTPQHGRLHYGNFNGLPSEWFYDFAQKNMDRFEEHVRSIGYEVDLAETPGIGTLSTLPDTPGFLEMIIPPEHNPGINFRDVYSKSTSTDAGTQEGQFRIQQASQGSPVKHSSNTNASDKSSHGPVEGHDSGHDSGHHNSRTPNTAEALRLRDIALDAFRLANEGFDLSTNDILENDAVAQSLGLSKEESELKSVGTSSKTNASSDLSEYPSPYNRSPSTPGSHSTESPSFQAQPSQGSQKSREDDGQPGPSRVGRAASLVDLTSDSESGSERLILKPISRKAKIHKLSRTFPELEGELASFIDHRQRKYKAKPPPPIITSNLGTEAKFLEVAAKHYAAKRCADHTFTSRSAQSTESDSNNSKGSKKLRHDDPSNEPAAPPSLNEAQSTAGSLRTAALRAITLPSAIIKSPPGYAGQFNGLRLYDLYVLSRQPMSIRNTPRNPVEAVFGSQTHANPMIYHPALPVLPASSSRRRSPHEAPSPVSHHHSRLFRLARIVDVSSDSHTTLRRTTAQEQLRTEIHRELANASLNGVSIGKYRYYQGHLTVEEYLERGMCVCWDRCACSSFCSVYGDMICPCSEILEILDDDNDDASANASAGANANASTNASAGVIGGDANANVNADEDEDALGEEEPDCVPNASESREEQEQEATDSNSSKDEQETEQKAAGSDASPGGENPEEVTTDSDVSEEAKEQEQETANADASENEEEPEDEATDSGDSEDEEDHEQGVADPEATEEDEDYDEDYDEYYEDDDEDNLSEEGFAQVY